MEWLKLEVFLDMKVTEFVLRFKFAMRANELLMVADRVMICAYRMKRSLIGFPVVLIRITAFHLSILLLYRIVFFA